MSIQMPENIKEERLRWVLPIVHREVKLVDAVKLCPHGKRSLERWVAHYKKYGEEGVPKLNLIFEPPKTASFTNKTDSDESVLPVVRIFTTKLEPFLWKQVEERAPRPRARGAKTNDEWERQKIFSPQPRKFFARPPGGGRFLNFKLLKS